LPPPEDQPLLALLYAASLGDYPVNDSAGLV
jgi:hypothetical protein